MSDSQDARVLRIPSTLVRSYYVFATPVFWLVDLLWDAPIRVSFIPDSRLRYAYYAGCIGCGLLIWKWPALSRGVGLTESLTNFTLALLSIWVPILGAYDAVANTATEPSLNLHPLNAGLAGLSALMSYYSHQRD